jgi:hypothetical protein
MDIKILYIYIDGSGIGGKIDIVIFDIIIQTINQRYLDIE